MTEEQLDELDGLVTQARGDDDLADQAVEEMEKRIIALHGALETLVIAVNRYETPHDLVAATLRGVIDGEGWSASWARIRDAKSAGEALLAKQNGE